MAYGKNVLLDLVEALESLPAEVVTTTHDRFVEIAEEEAARAGKARMSFGARSYKLTAQLKSVKVDTAGATMTFLGFPVGFWVWAEEGVRAHQIAPRVRVRSELGMYRAAMTGGLGHPIITPVRHPGIRGRAAWTHTCDRMDEEMGAVIDDAANNLDLWG